jgi:hypothetical protein
MSGMMERLLLFYFTPEKKCNKRDECPQNNEKSMEGLRYVTYRDLSIIIKKFSFCCRAESDFNRDIMIRLYKNKVGTS